MNMLICEYNYEEDIATQREEERQIAFAQGIERGIEQGFSDGSYQTKLETAKILKKLGDSIQKIMHATGSSKNEIEML